MQGKRKICLKPKKKKRVEYNTEKKELLRESSWIRAKNWKKKKQIIRLHHNNKLAGLDIQALPPTIVDKINNFNEIHAIVNQILGSQAKSSSVEITVP